MTSSRPEKVWGLRKGLKARVRVPKLSERACLMRSKDKWKDGRESNSADWGGQVEPKRETERERLKEREGDTEHRVKFKFDINNE